MRTNTLAKLSGRPGLVSLGLCTVAGSALLLGAVVGLMLADLARPSDPLVATSTATEAPQPMPTGESGTVTPDGSGMAPAPVSPAAPDVAPAATVPTTASIAAPIPAAAEPRGAASRPPANLPLDLDPRAAHALAALIPTGFLVEAGTFANEPTAKALAEALAGLAAPVHVVPIARGGGEGGWQVAAGPFADAAAASATAATIRRTVGIEPRIRAVEPAE